MSIIIKTDDQIELMRQSGHLLAKVHEELHQMIHPGMSTMEIDTIGEKLIRQMGGIPNFKNYEGYPASICVSVNDEVVHVRTLYEVTAERGTEIGRASCRERV